MSGQERQRLTGQTKGTTECSADSKIKPLFRASRSRATLSRYGWRVPVIFLVTFSGDKVEPFFAAVVSKIAKILHGNEG